MAMAMESLSRAGDQRPLPFERTRVASRLRHPAGICFALQERWLARAREDISFAQKDRELIARLREKDQQELDQAILELCQMRCPKCGRKLEEIVYQRVRVGRCTGCGGVWIDPGELETLATEEHQSCVGGLVSGLTGRGEESC
jgi:hypothetical protein